MKFYLDIKQAVIIFVVTVFLIEKGISTQVRIAEVKENKCVTTIEEKHSMVRSSMICISLCLNTKNCKAVTFISRLQTCTLSSNDTLEDCSLSVGDVSTTGLTNFKRSCPSSVDDDFCNADAQVYYEFSDTTETWEQARANCEASSGRLAVLDSEEKRVWMREFRLTQSGAVNSQFHWIGLWDEEGLHNWEWINEVILVDGRSNSWWNGGQPDHRGGTWCVEMYPANSNSRWNDQSCNQARRYICEHSF